MMDDRKRCDGVGALFCVLGGGGVDKIRAFSSVFVYFEGAQSAAINALHFTKKAAEAIDCFINRFLEPLYKGERSSI